MILALLALLSRRDESLWVFGRRSGVGDGPLAILLELRRRTAARTVWITRSDADDEAAAAHSIESVRDGSLAALRICLKAGTGIMTHGFSDLGGPAIWGARVVQLWHGAPLKRIGLDRIEPGSLGRALIRGASAIFERYWNGHYTWLVAGCDETGRRLRSGLGVKESAIIACGDPRMDLIPSQASHAREILRNLAMTRGLEGRHYVLIAPTWREDGEASVLPGVEERGLISSRDDVVLFVRAHPFSADMNSLSSVRNVVALPSGPFPDITGMLGAFDILMTDYSSIAMDFAVTGRPIVLVAPDLEQYSRSPGLYQSYEGFSAGLGLRTWSEGFVRLEALLDEGDTPIRKMHCDASRVMGEKYHPLGASGNASRLLDVLCQSREGL
ncbi:CDP-glycerol glycerophosphotransferase family protein [Stenotrophomonas maltophilia]|uniref:CDP-glycerol glycerophosphotransferase family protein n=1 Tax=Stenotrophomonas maltophilia TaxID=40324 RepID=UPI0012FD66BA|nr:CDP-glycerol glycerophosphotransferase family protein [Stenotrophomonas maltophilia]